MVSPTSLARITDEKWDWRKDEILKDDPPAQRCTTTGWAYAAVAAVETNLQMHGIFEKLSVQNLIDCCYVRCGIFQVLSYIRDKGITTATQYPTLLPPAAAQGPCQRCPDLMAPSVKIKKVTTVGVKDMSERDLMNTVKKTPLIVAVWVGKKFDEYRKEDNIHRGEGFFANDPKKEDVYRHYVLLVGYDTEKGGDGERYWILRNSHGTTWGDNGYMKLHRDQTHKFNVAIYPEEAFLVPVATP